MLTLAIYVIALAALGALSIRFGCDSRPGAWSVEQEYAAEGYAWSDGAREGRTRGTGQHAWLLAAAQHRLRRALLVVPAVVLLAAGIGGPAAHAQTPDAVSVLVAFTGALGASDVDQLTNLFGPHSLIQDGNDYMGTTEAHEWAEGLLAGRLQIDLQGDPEVGPSSGDPMPGEWIIWSARFTRAGGPPSEMANFQDVKEGRPNQFTLGLSAPVDLKPLDGSLAAIVQNGHVVYLSVRPHFLWMRRVDQEQSDELIERAMQSVLAQSDAGIRIAVPPDRAADNRSSSSVSDADATRATAIYDLTTTPDGCSFSRAESVPAIRPLNQIYGTSQYIAGLRAQLCPAAPG
jgi:hypothetical protein